VCRQAFTVNNNICDLDVPRLPPRDAAHGGSLSAVPRFHSQQHQCELAVSRLIDGLARRRRRDAQAAAARKAAAAAVAIADGSAGKPDGGAGAAAAASVHSAAACSVAAAMELAQSSPDVGICKPIYQ
jgi:hypothetical protein